MHLVDMIRNVINSAVVYLGYNSVIETSFLDELGGELVPAGELDSDESLGKFRVLLRPKYAGGLGAGSVTDKLLSIRTTEAIVGLCSISS